jgi:hypothetical protein
VAPGAAGAAPGVAPGAAQAARAIAAALMPIDFRNRRRSIMLRVCMK